MVMLQEQTCCISSLRRLVRPLTHMQSGVTVGADWTSRCDNPSSRSKAVVAVVIVVDVELVEVVVVVVLAAAAMSLSSGQSEKCFTLCAVYFQHALRTHLITHFCGACIQQ